MNKQKFFEYFAAFCLALTINLMLMAMVSSMLITTAVDSISDQLNSLSAECSEEAPFLDSHFSFTWKEEQIYCKIYVKQKELDFNGG